MEVILTNNGKEFCGGESHPYGIYLVLNDIEHRNSKVGRPQTNGFVKRFNRTVLDEFFRETFRRKLYESIETLQDDLDEWLLYYCCTTIPSGPTKVIAIWEGDLSRGSMSTYMMYGKKAKSTTKTIKDNAIIDKIYQARFDSATVAAKKELWKVLVAQFLQRHIPTDASVIDIGGGYCEFINNVRCRRKYVVELNPDVQKYADPNVEIIMSDAKEISSLPDSALDIAFASNFFEHLSSKQQLFDVLSEIHRILKKGGKLLIIQPNIKYTYREYWDFIDHHIPLTENSLGEALINSGFEIDECVPRFLPFSVDSSPSKSAKLLSLYLKMPLFWKIFGKQTFMVGVKP